MSERDWSWWQFYHFNPVFTKSRKSWMNSNMISEMKKNFLKSRQWWLTIWTEHVAQPYGSEDMQTFEIHVPELRQFLEMMQDIHRDQQDRQLRPRSEESNHEQSVNQLRNLMHELHCMSKSHLRQQLFLIAQRSLRRRTSLWVRTKRRH